MDDKARRKDLVGEYKESRPDAGVYRIVSGATGRSLVGSTMNLRAMQNRVAFAKSVDSPSALDGRLAADIRQHGIDAFGFEVLETVEVSPTDSRAKVEADLATLEALWREKLAAGGLY